MFMPMVAKHVSRGSYCFCAFSHSVSESGCALGIQQEVWIDRQGTLLFLIIGNFSVTLFTFSSPVRLVFFLTLRLSNALPPFSSSYLMSNFRLKRR